MVFMWKKYLQILTHEKAQGSLRYVFFIITPYIYEGKRVSDVTNLLHSDTETLQVSEHNIENRQQSES